MGLPPQAPVASCRSRAVTVRALWWRCCIQGRKPAQAGRLDEGHGYRPNVDTSQPAERARRGAAAAERRLNGVAYTAPKSRLPKKTER